MVNRKIWNVEKHYVIHASHGYEAREKMLRKLFEKYQLEVEFASEASDTAVNSQWIQQYFSSEAIASFSKAELYCALGHILIYQRMVNANIPLAVIFEDDVCFLQDYKTAMPEIAKQAQLLPPGFIVSLENSTLKFPSRKVVKKGHFLYGANVARCTGAYLIDLKAAASIMDYLTVHKCHLGIDWWHNHLIGIGVLKMYWAHPPVTEQGSFNGQFPSSISRRSSGYFRKLQWEIQKFYKRHVLWYFR